MAGEGKQRVRRGLCIVLAALSAAVLSLAIAWRAAARRPDRADTPIRPATAAVTADTVPDEEAPLLSPAPVLERKEGVWTFLLCAEDQVSGNADTIMVCAYDTVNQKMGLVSVPRDTLVDRPGWKYHRINAAYPSGNLAYPPDGGIRELMAAVGEVLGIPMDHYVLVDTRLFVELVDAVGGVDFDVPVYMCYDAPDQDLHIHFQPGLQHLNGRQALAVARCRKNSDGPGEYPHNLYDAYPDADIGRTRTQQALVKAIAQKLLQSPQKLPGYVELLERYVKTDLTLGNLLWLAQPALDFDLAGLTTATLPGRGDAVYQGVTSLYELDIEGSLAIINDCLNPYTTPVTGDMVRMLRGE